MSDKPNGPLTEADKARIRAEEEFRQQLRAEAPQGKAPPPPAPKPALSTKQQLQQGGILALVILLVPVLMYFYFSRTGSSGLAGATLGGTYRYEVDASCPIDVTYGTSNGTEQRLQVSAPWSESATGVGIPQVIAQLKCDSGSVTARILKGDKVYKEATSSGAYAIAHAH